MVAAGADWLDADPGKATDEEEESFLDILLNPWLIAAYVIVGLIACISSILLLKRARL